MDKPELTPELFAALFASSLGPVVSSGDGMHAISTPDFRLPDTVSVSDEDLRRAYEDPDSHPLIAPIAQAIVDAEMERVLDALERGGFRRVT